MSDETHATPERLYGVPDAECLHWDFNDAIEEATELACPDESGTATIEEWSVHPIAYHLPDPDHVLEWIDEWAAEMGEVVDGFCLPVERPELLSAAQHLLDTIAAHTKWRMANERVATHTVQWHVDSDGRVQTTEDRGEQ